MWRTTSAAIPRTFTRIVGDEEDSALWEYQEGTFRYAGGGTVTWAFRDGATGQLQESAMTFASDGRGNVEFTAEGALLDG